jgi:hypothetical protein
MVWVMDLAMVMDLATVMEKGLVLGLEQLLHLIWKYWRMETKYSKMYYDPVH